MNAFERRNQIIERMQVRKFDTASNFASEFGVTKRTILTDIQELVCSGYPIQSDAGRGGGIRWTGNKRQFPFSERELVALRNAIAVVSAEDRAVLENLIRDNDNPQVRIDSNEIFELLRDSCLSQTALAQTLGISGTLLTLVLSGQRKPSAELSKRIANYKKEVFKNGKSD